MLPSVDIRYLLHSQDFKPLEFEGFRGEAGLHAFTMSPSKWIEGVNAIGIVSKAGRYGGKYERSFSFEGEEADVYIIRIV